MGSLPSDRPSHTGTEDPEHERIEFMLRTLDHVFDEHKAQMNQRFDEAKKGQEMLLLRVERLFEVVQSGQAPLTTRVALVEEKVNKLSSVVYWVAATSVTSALGVAAALFVAFATRHL
jgi:hypothetical protein